MAQDHMCYNMSVVSAEVHGIMDLDASAEVICPQSGDTLGRLSLRETLMKYLKQKDGTPLVAELHHVEKRSFSLAALPISLYRDIPKPNVDLHGRVDTAGPPQSD